MLGTTELPGGQSTCGMPVSLQIERVRRDLLAQVGDTARVLEVDLYSLEGADRETALDALVSGTESPYVLMGGKLVCAGTIDSAAMIQAASAQLW